MSGLTRPKHWITFDIVTHFEMNVRVRYQVLVCLYFSLQLRYWVWKLGDTKEITYMTPQIVK